MTKGKESDRLTLLRVSVKQRSIHNEFLGVAMLLFYRQVSHSG